VHRRGALDHFLDKGCVALAGSSVSIDLRLERGMARQNTVV